MVQKINSMNMNIRSPITNSNNVILEKDISADLIMKKYKEGADIDISRFFKGIKKIYIYKCLDTGYRFYYPLNLEGDDEFYKKLQKYPWYYMDWKWEYEKAYNLIKFGEKILEIGCGKGDFINKLRKKKNNEVCGLEFNMEAIKKSQEKGLYVIKETIQEYAKNNKGKYDVVCSFQVMEHIAKIGDAIRDSLAVLKKGGKLIITVPNNDSFIKKDKIGILNMPPHHVGLWGEKSLKNLDRFFNLKLQNIYFEPLQDYHYRYYYNTVFGQRIDEIFGKYGKIINKILGRISLHYLTKPYYPKKIKGHTVMAVYIKN
ncbi:methyltransferase domain-containing protein [Patescibacteria group bacterium]